VWLSLDCMYYFTVNIDTDDSQFKGNIPLHKFQSLEINDISKSSKDSNLSNMVNDIMNIFGNDRRMDYYGFKLVVKNRTYEFYTDFITELNKWTTVIANCS